MGKETSRKNTKSVQESGQGLNHLHLCLKGTQGKLTPSPLIMTITAI